MRILSRVRSVFNERVYFTLRQIAMDVRLGKAKSVGTRKIACIAQVKNEVDLIEDWVNYNVYLFGEGNVYVLDDGSDDGTERVLSHYEKNGLIHVNCLIGESRGLWRKYINLTDAINRIKKDYDLIIPLDCDEFICARGRADKDEIIDELKRLNLDEWGLFKFKNEYESSTWNDKHNHPAREISEFERKKPGVSMKKVFFSAAYFKQVGEGQHTGYTKNKNTVPYVCKLSLFHFKWRGKIQMKEKCLKGAEGFNYWDGTRLAGMHYRRGLGLVSTEEHDEFFAKNIPVSNVSTTSLSELLVRLSESTNLVG